MAKRLDLKIIESIKDLVKQGISKSKIARNLGIDRKTVYHHISEKLKIKNRIRALRYKGLSIDKWKRSYKSMVRKDLEPGSYYQSLTKKDENLPISQLYAHKIKKYK